LRLMVSVPHRLRSSCGAERNGTELRVADAGTTTRRKAVPGEAGTSTLNKCFDPSTSPMCGAHMSVVRSTNRVGVSYAAVVRSGRPRAFPLVPLPPRRRPLCPHPHLHRHPTRRRTAAARSASVEAAAGTSDARARCHLLLPVAPRCLLLHRRRNPRERREATAGPAALERARCPTGARSNNGVGAQSRIAGRVGPCGGRGERRPPSRGAARTCQPLLTPPLAPHLLLARHYVASPPLLAATTSP
jgi:hypothetical protein